jgi:hypothetical protein
LVAALLTLSSGDLYAQDRALLFEPVEPSLAAAIRIQLAGVAEVRLHPAIEMTLEERIEAVARTLSAQEADLGLWVETSTAPYQTIVFILRERDGVPSVETASVAGALAPDLERALALKVLEIVGPRSVDLEADPSASVLRFSAEIGALGTIAREGRGQVGGHLGLGGRYQRDRFLIELHTGARLFSGLAGESSAGGIELSEWSWSLGLRALLSLGALWLGVGVDGSLRFLRADGRTPAGSEGRTSLLVPALAGGLELRAPIWAELLEARVFAGPGLNLKRQQLAVNQTPVLDLGRWYGVAQLSLVLAFP